MTNSYNVFIRFIFVYNDDDDIGSLLLRVCVRAFFLLFYWKCLYIYIALSGEQLDFNGFVLSIA